MHDFVCAEFYCPDALADSKEIQKIWNKFDMLAFGNGNIILE